MVNCEQCGREFKQRFGKERFCSRGCWAKSREAEKIKMICPTCGDEFEVKSFLVKEGKKNFCSRECYVKSRKIHKYEERICEYCGETFEVYSKTKKRYCDVSCSNRHRFQLKREEEFNELLQNV